MGTTAGDGWGLVLDDEGLALGMATGVADMDTAKVKEAPALRITASKIEATAKYTWMKLEGDSCTIAIKNKKIRFEASSGPITVNGAKILLK